MPTQIGLISLGCAKNLIDSEIMLGHLRNDGMTLIPDPELAGAASVAPGSSAGADAATPELVIS